MIRRDRMTYFGTQRFLGKIRCKNEEWSNFGVKINPKKIEKTLVDMK